MAAVEGLLSRSYSRFSKKVERPTAAILVQQQWRLLKVPHLIYVYVNAVDTRAFGLYSDSDDQQRVVWKTATRCTRQLSCRGGRASAHRRPSATARPSTDGHARRLKRCGARLFGKTPWGQQIVLMVSCAACRRHQAIMLKSDEDTQRSSILGQHIMPYLLPG